MNDLDYFRNLRPDDTISDADLDAIRSQLFGDRTHDAVQDPADDDTPGDTADAVHSAIDIDRHRRPQFRRLAVVAAALLFVGGGVWVVNQRRNSTPDSVSEAIDSTGTTLAQPTTTGPATTAPVVDNTPAFSDAAAAGPYAPPLIGIDEPGWTVTYAAVNRLDPPDQLVFLSEDRFDGAWFELNSGRVDTTLLADAIGQPPLDGAEIVDHKGMQVAIISNEGGTIAHWFAAPDHSASIYGWGMAKNQVLALIENIGVEGDGRVRLWALPAGSVEATPEEYAALRTLAGYQFTNTDGRRLEVRLNPGGQRGLLDRQGPSGGFAEEGRRLIVIGDESATIIDYNTGQYTPAPSNTVDPELAGEAPLPPGRYRVDVLRGFWTWEFETENFASEQDVTDIVGITGTVDHQTFDTSLGDDIVPAADRAAAVDEMLADVPLPDGFDRSPLDTGFSESRYQIIAHVSETVVCAWSGEWLDARDANDADRQRVAVEALASARDWSMLHETADEDGWLDSIRQAAKEFPRPLDQMTRSEADEYLVSAGQC